MLLGADRRAAAEFSFWLAMPTMAGAFAYDLYKDHGQLSHSNLAIIAVGFIVSFICAWFVVKTFLGYVSRHGFALFVWWRVGGRHARPHRAGAGAVSRPSIQAASASSISPRTCASLRPVRAGT